MDRDEILNLEDKILAKVYHRRNIIVDRGKDALLWDLNGKKYIDCMTGFGVGFIGHSNHHVISAVKTQADKLLSCHGSLYLETRARLVKKLIDISPKKLNRIFLSNSGTEAIELALKLARKFTGKKEIIAMMRSYHGKTMGALSVTWNAKYRVSFEPLIPNIKFVPYGKADKLREAITEKTAAIIVEPIQGEGGIYVAPEGYLKELRKIADDKNLLLIFDEVQTGFCRTGRMFAFEHWDVIPDIFCVSKAMGSGLPIAATISRNDILATLKVGEHSSTFGGNPLSCAAAAATIEVLIENKFWERAERLGTYFMNQLNKLKERYKIIREVRGLGLMIGMELRVDVQSIMQKMLEKGTLILNAGVNILRFLPPVVITEEQINTATSKLDECLKDKEANMQLSY